MPWGAEAAATRAAARKARSGAAARGRQPPAAGPWEPTTKASRPAAAERQGEAAAVRRSAGSPTWGAPAAAREHRDGWTRERPARVPFHPETPQLGTSRRET